MVLEVEYPYEGTAPSFSDSFYTNIGYSDSLNQRFFYDALPIIFVFILVCFFGVFFFPIASVLLGKFDAKYIAFGSLCFCSGFYMIMQRAGEYLNLWIMDPTVCMMTDKLAFCFFAMSVMYYLKSLLKGKLTKTLAALTAILYVAATITVTVLHLTDTADMMVTSRLMIVGCLS